MTTSRLTIWYEIGDQYFPTIRPFEDTDEIKKSKLATIADLALEMVNSIRIALMIGEGKLEAFPAGYVRDAKMCVLARALSNGWASNVAEFIELIHPRDGTVDFASTLQALEDRGARNARLVYGYTEWIVDEETGREEEETGREEEETGREEEETGREEAQRPVCGVKFDTPALLTEFFSAFDEGKYEHLILDGDSEEGRLEKWQANDRWDRILQNITDDPK